MSRIITLAVLLLTATIAHAQVDNGLDWSGRYRELERMLRTETDPAALIGAYVEYRHYPGVTDNVPPPDGGPGAVALRRIADNPGLYAPEIRRRLLNLFPERIEDAEQLATLGSPEILTDIMHRLMVLSDLSATLGREHAEPILRELWDRSTLLLHQIEPIYDEEIAKWNDMPQIPKESLWMVESEGLLWMARLYAMESASALDSPVFIDDVLRTMERVRQRPEDPSYPGFASPASDYLLPFVEQRPDIYTRLLPLADQDEMARLGSGASNLAYMIKDEVRVMRQKLIEAGKLPPED